MSQCVDIEIRPTSLTPKERAEARDSYVRSFERQFRDWSEIAKCCLEVDRDGDWEILGFHSFHAWLVDAAPASRRYLYLVMKHYRELIQDIPDEELKEIPLGSAGVLATISRSKRKDPAVRKAAKKKPSEFISDIQKLAPEMHIECKLHQNIQFTASQWSVVEATFEKYKVMRDDPNASLACFIEWMCSEVSEWTLHAETAGKSLEKIQ